MSYHDTPIYKWHLSQEEWHRKQLRAFHGKVNQRKLRWHRSQAKWHGTAKYRGVSITEVVAQVVQDSAYKIARNVAKNNALLMQLKCGSAGRRTSPSPSALPQSLSQTLKRDAAY